MANIAASDVTVTVLRKRTIKGRKHHRVRLTFGNGALTYPAGGIPLDKARMGCANKLESLIVDDKGTSGYQFSYDESTQKLVMLQSPSHTHNLTIIGGAAPAEAVGVSGVGNDVLGKSAATNRTIVGADVATKGGVNASTAAAMTEPSAVAIAQQVIECEIIGW